MGLGKRSTKGEEGGEGGGFDDGDWGGVLKEVKNVRWRGMGKELQEGW